MYRLQALTLDFCIYRASLKRVVLKLDKLFKEQHHEKRGITDRIDYIFSRKLKSPAGTHDAGSVFLSVAKSPAGGWIFLGRHFNSIQGAKKEARRYCNEKAGELAGGQ
jgi:hypothetical protein